MLQKFRDLISFYSTRRVLTAVLDANAEKCPMPPIMITVPLVEETDDFPADVFPTSLLVIHNPRARREHHVAELTGRKQPDHPLLQI